MASPALLLRSALALLATTSSVVAMAEQREVLAAKLKSMSVEQLMDIEVTSVSRHAERISRVPSAVQVITNEEVRRSGAMTLPQALRLAANLEVAQIDARQWAISARGFNSTTSNKMLVLMDGRTVYTPLYAGVFWDAQDTNLDDIDQIEVISGPGATLWGANAVNGVISIRTRGARETQGLQVSAAAGNEIRSAGGLRYGGAISSNLYYRAYAKYLGQDDTVLPNGVNAVNGWRRSQAGFRLDGDLSANETWTVQGDIYDGKISQPAADDVVLSGANMIGRWTRVFSTGSELQLQMYFDRTHRRIPRTFAEDLDSYDLDFQHRFQFGNRHQITWGGGYRLIDDDIENSAAIAFLPPRVTREWISLFVQDEIALVGDELTATLGSKIEHNEYTGIETQPSVRLAWRVSDGDTFWSSVSRAMRTPSRIDREFYSPGSPPFVLAGGRDFKSEELIAYEVGYRNQRHRRLSFSVSTFYNDYDDVRSTERLNPPAPFPIFIGNGLKARSYGAELTAKYQPINSWQLQVGYTQLRLAFQRRPGSTGTNRGTVEARDPKRQASLRSLLSLSDRWQLDVHYRYVGRIDAQRVPEYKEIDARLAWQPADNLELALTGQNLLHAHHAEFGVVTPSLSNTRKEIERSVFAHISWRH
jgi:iron complex outermembrane recepter protein